MANLLNLPIPIPIAQGGTGATSVTTGSVIFASSGTAYGQSNSQLFWDNSNNRLGIGTNSPGYQLHISSSGSATSLIKTTSSLGAAFLNFDRNGTSSQAYLLFTTAGTTEWQIGTGINLSSNSSLIFYSGGNQLTLDTSGNLVVTSKMSSASANISGLTASTVVFTDSSKNLTSTGTVTIAKGGTNNSSFNSAVNAGQPIVFFNGTSLVNDTSLGYDTTFDILKIYSGLGNPQFAVKTTVTGSANSASDVLDRGDQANGGCFNYYLTAGTSNWQNGIYPGTNDFIFKNPGTAVLTLGNSTTDVTVGAGNLIVNTAGKTVKIKQGSNACSGTGVTLSSGTATVNTTAIATGDTVLITKTANGGTTTTGMPAVSISNGVSFTLTGSTLDTSTYSWIIIKPS